jgi:hypothetical protein
MHKLWIPHTVENCAGRHHVPIVIAIQSVHMACYASRELRSIGLARRPVKYLPEGPHLNSRMNEERVRLLESSSMSDLKVDEATVTVNEPQEHDAPLEVTTPKLPRWKKWLGYLWDSYGAEPVEARFVQKVDIYLL